MKKFKDINKSFSYAIEGIVTALKRERNMRIHFAMAILAIVLSFVLDISRGERTAVILSISTVMGAELINTSIEALVDLVTEDFKPLAKIAKDTAAGAVLITAVGAFLVGIVVFLGPIIEMIRNFIGG